MSEEQYDYSKEELLQQLDDLSQDLNSDIDKAEDLQDRFDRQDTLYRNTAGNDDGNEDRPETFNEDGDNVQGMERGEELIRLEKYIETAPEYHKDIEALREKIEKTDEPEALESIVEKIDDLKETLEDIRPEDLMEIINTLGTDYY